MNPQMLYLVLIALFQGFAVNGQFTPDKFNISISNTAKHARGADINITTYITQFVVAGFYLNDAVVSNTLALVLENDPTCSNLTAVLPSVSRRCTATQMGTLYRVDVTLLNVPLSYTRVIWDIDGSQNSINLNIQNCRNVTSSNLVQDVPPDQGYLSRHTFSCITGYQVSNQNSECQADATWSPTPSCTALCNDATVPSNSSYIVPTSGTTLHMNTLTLQCAGNYTGSASAVCTDVDVWDVTSNCTPSCNQSTIPTDASYSHSGTSVTLVNGVVTLTCSNGYTGNAEATCVGPGQWNVTTTCSGNQGLTTDQKVGIGVGVSLGILVLGGCAFLLWKYKPWQQYTGVPTK